MMLILDPTHRHWSSWGYENQGVKKHHLTQQPSDSEERPRCSQHNLQEPEKRYAEQGFAWADIHKYGGLGDHDGLMWSAHWPHNFAEQGFACSQHNFAMSIDVKRPLTKTDKKEHTTMPRRSSVHTPKFNIPRVITTFKPPTDFFDRQSDPVL